MITNILFFIVGLFVSLVQGIFNMATSLVPGTLLTNFTTAVQTLLGYLGYFNGVFPVDTLLQALVVFTTLLIAVYTWRIVLWALNFIPFFSNSLKDSPSPNVVDLRETPKGSLNLRGVKAGSGYKAKKLRI